MTETGSRPRRGPRWRVYAAIYRTLVVAQTLGWAVSSLARVVTHHPRSSPSAQPIATALAVGSVVGIAAGLLAYYVRRSRQHDRDSVVLAWAWFQGGGLSALIGYAISGTAVCFIIGMVTLAVMHGFSPNRFQTEADA